MAAEGEKRGFRQRALGTWPRRTGAGIAVSLLLFTGCSLLDENSADCPDPNPGLTAGQLEGTYAGPGGMTVTLSPGEDSDVLEGGDLKAEKWPYELFHIDEGKVGPDADGEVRSFTGKGTWSYEPAEGRVALDFDAGIPEGDVPLDTQYLTVGGTSEKPLLFEQEDPDTCPDAVFRS